MIGLNFSSIPANTTIQTFSLALTVRYKSKEKVIDLVDHYAALVSAD
jgi:hypothetical protein